MRSLDRSAWRSGFPLLGALALHAAIAMALHRTPREHAGPQGDARRPETIVELSLAEQPDSTAHAPGMPSARDSAVATARDGRADARGRAVERSREPPRDAPRATGDTESGEAYAVDALRPNAAAPGTGAPPPVALGIEPGSWAKWGDFEGAPERSAEPSSRPAPAPASSTGGVAELLDESDRALGLGSAGAVLSAARDAASSDVAPWSGTVQFAVTIDREGGVDVVLAAFSRDPVGWTEVGKRLATCLRRRPPPVRGHHRAVRVVIELAAAERNATGSATHPSRGLERQVTAPALRSVAEARAELSKQESSIAPPPGAPAEQRALSPITDAPGVFAGKRGRVADVAAGLGAVGELGHGDPGNKVSLGAVLKGNFDLANLLSRPTRNVTTRVVSETLL